MTNEDQELINKFCELSNYPAMSGYAAAMIEAHAKKCAIICMEYAKQQAIDFFKWYGVRMASFLEYITKVRPIVRSEEIEDAILKHEGATFEQLYAQFIESQTPPKDGH